MTRTEVELALESSEHTYPLSHAPLPVVHSGIGSDQIFRIVDGVIEVAFCTRYTFKDAVWGDDPFTDFPWRVAHLGDFSA